jgi:membrane fusion protein
MAEGNERDHLPAVTTPAEAQRAVSDLRLFRTEVITERQSQWLGTVKLAPRASFRLFTVLAILVAAAVIALLVFANFTRTARINGWLLPHEGVIRVYAPRPGVVGSLDVKEGSHVRAGDRLLTLSDELQSSAVGATQEQITQQLAQRRASLVEERSQQQLLLRQQQRALANRARALRAEEEQLQSDIQLLKERVAIAARAEALHQEQYKEGFISEMRLQQVQAELIEQRARLGAAERARLVSVRERMTVEAELIDLPIKAAKETALLDRNIAQVEQERAEAEAKREIVVEAPHDGTVTAIQIVPGAKADPGAPLLSIVPPDMQLEAHLYGPSRAVGFVRPGQRVLLRYQAYPFQRFGHYEGVVTSVSRTALNPGELPQQLAGLTSLTGATAGAAAEPIYQITVKLASQTVKAYGSEVPLQAGMLLEADVALERRRLFEWVLDPLYAIKGYQSG